jgi:hypothetical protein
MTDPLVASEAGLTGDEVMAQRNAFRNSFAADKWCNTITLPLSHMKL